MDDLPAWFVLATQLIDAGLVVTCLLGAAITSIAICNLLGV